MILPDDLDDLPNLKAEQLGAFLNVTGERIRQLAKDGVITKVARGEFPWRKSILAYVNWIREGKSKRATGGDGVDAKAGLEEERRRMTAAKADLAEIQANIVRGRVHEAEAVEAAWTDCAFAARAKLLAVPDKAAPMIDPHRATEIKILLTELIHEALTELADYDATRISERTDTKRLLAGASPGDDVGLEAPAEA